MTSVPACRSHPVANETGDARPADAVAALDLEPYRARARVPALVAVAVDRSRVVYEGATGFADLEARRPATVDVPFPAASLAKLVVGASGALLVDAGRLADSDDASRLLGMPLRSPRAPSLPITFRALLEHRSGLRDRWSLLEAERQLPDGGPRELAAFARDYLRDQSDGTAWSSDPPGTFRYANVGTTFAALAMERREGAPFEEVAARLVLRPLGMTNASFRPTPGAAAGYAATDGSFRRVPARDRAVHPAAGLFASGRDLGRLARVLVSRGELDGARVWPEAAVRRLLEPAFGVQAVALGDAGSFAGHEGEDAGASSAFVLDPARGVGVVVLANGDAFASGDASRARALVELCLDLLALATK